MPASDECILLRCQHRMPDGRRSSTVEAQPAEVELSLPDPAQQFNTGNCDRCGPESLRPERRTDACLHTAVILLDEVVQILLVAGFPPLLFVRKALNLRYLASAT